MTSSLPCRYSPFELFRLTESTRRLIPPSPLQVDSEFQNSIRAQQSRGLHRLRLLARAPKPPVPNCPRNRYTHFHPHPRSARLPRDRRKTVRRPRCEMRAPANLRRRECVSVRGGKVVTIWQSTEETSNAQRSTSNAQFLLAALHYSITPLCIDTASRRVDTLCSRITLISPKTRRGSQVVRSRSAKPLFAGSIPAPASFHT